jgi:hypothetical protein
MRLFELKEHVVSYSPQALLLAPFKKLWDRDKSKTKAVANAELAYVFYMEDVRSDFYDIMDEDDRKEEVLKFLPELKKWEEDQAVKDARLFYAHHSESLAAKFLKDMMKMVDNLRSTISNLNFSERDNQGRLLHDFGKMMDITAKAPGVLETLETLYKKIEDESQKENLMRGGRLKTAFEDGI